MRPNSLRWVYCLAMHHFRMELVQGRFGCSVCRNSLANCFIPSQVFLFATPLNMGNPFSPAVAIGNPRKTRFIVGLYCSILSVFGLGGFSKILNPVVASNAVDMVYSHGKTVVEHSPNKPVFRNVVTGNSSISIAVDVCSKSLTGSLFAMILNKEKASVPVFERTASGLKNIGKVFWGCFHHTHLCFLDMPNNIRFGGLQDA